MIDTNVLEKLERLDDATILRRLPDNERSFFGYGFQRGYYRALKDLWHPASEEPKASPHDEYGFVHTEDVVQLIVVTRNDETKFMYSTHQEEYDGDKEGYWLLYDEDANEYDPSEGDIKKVGIS